MKPLIIAEIANAHQGKPEILRGLINAAAEAGADAVKFQLFRYDRIATTDFEWYPTYVELFMGEEVWVEALEAAHALGLKVWADIFDDWALDFSQRQISLFDGFKLPPTVLPYPAIVSGVQQLNKPLLMGVGGWLDEEIESFLSAIAPDNLKELTLLLGYQGYPTRLAQMNLSRLSWLNNRFGLPVGIADHAEADLPEALEVPIMAFFAGAVVIEKHLTLDRSARGYDYYSALEPHEFKKMVARLKTADTIWGTLDIAGDERDYLKAVVRAVASESIGAGRLILPEKVTGKRSPVNDALTPKELINQLPAIATKDICVDQALTREHLRSPRITIAVICRLKSTRLPRKALLPINGISSIERCLINCLAVPDVDHVVLATSHLEEDVPLTQITLDGRVTVVAGDPDNVAQRMVMAAEATEADIVLRVTGDCPAVSPEIVEFLIQRHLETDSDFTCQDSAHAVGTGADIYNVAALWKLLSQSVPLTHTEYLSYYFKNNPHLFQTQLVRLPEPWCRPQWRLTLDESKDLEMFEALYTAADIGTGPLFFGKISSVLKQDPGISKINAGVNLIWRDDPDLMARIDQATRL